MTQEEIMQQIIQLVQEGAETTPLSTEADAALRARYFNWIVDKKKGVETTPIEIWEKPAGKEIQKQIKKIGKIAAKLAKDEGKEKIGRGVTETAALDVEQTSPCPHCPVVPVPEP